MRVHGRKKNPVQDGVKSSSSAGAAALLVSSLGVRGLPPFAEALTAAASEFFHFANRRGRSFQNFTLGLAARRK